MRNAIQVFAVFGVGFLVLVGASCGGNSNPPAPSSLDLSGAWSIRISDSARIVSTTVPITQSGSSIAGATGVWRTANGAVGASTSSVSGTLAGTTLTFTITTAVGAAPAPLALCSETLNGTAQSVTGQAINGTYTGTSVCPGFSTPITSGVLTMTK